LDLAKEFAAKASGAAKGSAAMLAVWMAIFWVWSQVKARSAAWRALGRVLVTAAFVLGLGALATLEFLDASDNLRDSLGVGRSVDVLTPILMLGLDGYVEGLKVATGAIEHGLLAGFTAIATATAAACRRIRALWDTTGRSLVIIRRDIARCWRGVALRVMASGRRGRRRITTIIGRLGRAASRPSK
jgi:hypothetical protein